MAIYAISDIHGHYATYKKLLEKLKFSENDFLYVVGDVIDRGRDGIKIIQDTMRRPNVELMLGNPTKLWSKANIFQSVWGEDYLSDDNTVKVHMSNIRSKLKSLDSGSEYIETVWGMGYRLIN